MFDREIQKELLALANQYPVISVMGPRQSGKTTIVRASFPHKPYANLESPDTRELALQDPRGFLDQFPDGAILDEIQRAPKLLSYIQTIVDESEQKGHFILTGSAQLQLHEAITQSLAGRCALLTLLPLSTEEIQNTGKHLSLDKQLLTGGYPRIFADDLDPTKMYRNYFQTYVERDLRQLINVKDLAQFQTFVKLCAGRVGQLLNLANLGSDVGISAQTAKHWISILEASFILFRLPPYFENLGKRMVKTPKLYFTDVGLACYLLGLTTPEQVGRDPLRGNLIENLVVTDLMKKRLNKGLDSALYFFRDAHGHEVDLIFTHGRELIPIEIKGGKTFQSNFLKGLKNFQNLAQERCQKGYLVYAGDQEQRIGDFELLNLSKAARIVDRP